MRHEIKDDRLKVYGNRRVKKQPLKTPNIQDLWAGVLQPANCILERIKGTVSRRAFHWTMPSKKRNIYRNFWKSGPDVVIEGQ